MKRIETAVLEMFGRNKKRPFRCREIAERLALHGKERKHLSRVLSQLVSCGQLEERKGLYRLSSRQRAVKGVLSITAKGYGFVCSENSEQEDLFVSARNIASAMNGDQVLAQHMGFDRNGRPRGRVVKVLQRAHASVLGVYHQQRGRAWVVPLDQTIARMVFVQQEDSLCAVIGQVVKLEFVRYPTTTAAGSGRIVEVLGAQDDPQVDIETVIQTHELPQHFSAEALAEAISVADGISADELAKRKDLRGLPLMTIDGETAKDFDDAVAVRKEANGNYRLWVCIADVAHYVAEGGALDQDAYERGTSVYFTGHCLPMLPELLSNGICSLNPAEDRLVMTAEMLFNQAGQCVAADFYPAVIRSQARLTYTEVATFLDKTGELRLPAKVAEQLPHMTELAGILGEMRRQRGCLELDVPDVEIVLDGRGFPTAVARNERTVAHHLIEEFMLAANEAVAAFLEKRNYPFLYRIHESPALDKLHEFQQLAAECGVGLVLKKNLQQELQRFLAEIADRPEARLLNQQLLRSLQRALYAPEKKGHFGLAAESYCHFTSPIRRYPDLTIHRTLKKALIKPKQKSAESNDKLIKCGQECSERERRAMAAERDLFELRRCQLMKDRIGEEFAGTISSVTEFGFFVELNDLFVEGLVHVRSLDGDYYYFEPSIHALVGERRRITYRVGMQVKVRVEKVDLWRRRLDFALVECG